MYVEGGGTHLVGLALEQTNQSRLTISSEECGMTAAPNEPIQVVQRPLAHTIHLASSLLFTLMGLFTLSLP